MSVLTSFSCCQFYLLLKLAHWVRTVQLQSSIKLLEYANRESISVVLLVVEQNSYLQHTLKFISRINMQISLSATSWKDKPHLWRSRSLGRHWEQLGHILLGRIILSVQYPKKSLHCGVLKINPEFLGSVLNLQIAAFFFN